MVLFGLLPPYTKSVLGIIPTFLSEDDPRPAREQFNENYAHGGGWNPMSGWTLANNKIITYDTGEGFLESYSPRAVAMLRDELIVVYDHSWVAIVQRDESFEVARMD